jgi:hypothetical protein
MPSFLGKTHGHAVLSQAMKCESENHVLPIAPEFILLRIRWYSTAFLGDPIVILRLRYQFFPISSFASASAAAKLPTRNSSMLTGSLFDAAIAPSVVWPSLYAEGPDQE